MGYVNKAYPFFYSPIIPYHVEISPRVSFYQGSNLPYRPLYHMFFSPFIFAPVETETAIKQMVSHKNYYHGWSKRSQR